ncbi:MAG: guanylate kinase [Victivallaceae bacterium]|nr:guanylate kinase [Victivallaceae bacterium]
MCKMMRGGDLIVLSGPSGVGKSTLVKKVRAFHPELEFSVSCTTRAMRPGEIDGKDYHFLDEEEFSRRSDSGAFLEEARIFRHRYGTLKSEVLERLRAGRSVLLDIDLQGAKQIRAVADADREIGAAAVFVMIVPPDLAALEKRLRERGSESDEQIALRLGAARRELAGFRTYDYLVVNDDLETAAADLDKILAVCRMRTAIVQGDPFV